eukprot:GHVS01051998.1.p1 GENE.GHVS01051998.1~~GHVS01051998.1.p1  ORF type:complete len:378 (+),score=16.18 GHVS01051998.1:140-1135(+)
MRYLSASPSDASSLGWATYRCVHASATEAFHTMIAKPAIASVDFPVFVLSSRTLFRRSTTLEGDTGSFLLNVEYFGKQADNEKLYVAETFGVDVNRMELVKDIATGLGVVDPYNRDGSWPLRGYRIKRTTPWGSLGRGSTVVRDIFVVSREEIAFISKYQSAALLARVIELALRNVTKKSLLFRMIDWVWEDTTKDTVNVHTIASHIQSLVGQTAEKCIVFVIDGTTGSTFNHVHDAICKELDCRWRQETGSTLNTFRSCLRFGPFALMSRNIKMKPILLRTVIDSTDNAMEEIYALQLRLAASLRAVPKDLRMDATVYIPFPILEVPVKV